MLTIARGVNPLEHRDGRVYLDELPMQTRVFGLQGGDDVIDAISGNICRCTGYEPIIDAILTAAGEMRGNKKSA